MTLPHHREKSLGALGVVLAMLGSAFVGVAFAMVVLPGLTYAAQTHRAKPAYQKVSLHQDSEQTDSNDEMEDASTDEPVASTDLVEHESDTAEDPSGEDSVSLEEPTEEVIDDAIGDDESSQRFLDPQTQEPLTGWYVSDGVCYFLASDGTPLTGWQQIDYVTYCFDYQGALVTGWAEGEDGQLRWLKDDGTMAADEWIEIDGVWEVFDVDGAWVPGEDVLPPDDALHVAEMTERQQAVVNACDTTPWPGKALCAAWVSQVFVNAGESAVPGDACDLAARWCVSSDLSELRPGMIIAVPSHTRTENGRTWGHVCIYEGNGFIRDSGTVGIRRVRLGTWFAWFGVSNQPRWGWANGIALA